MVRVVLFVVILACSIQSVWADNRAKTLYGRFTSAELSLQFFGSGGEPLVGVSTFEKSITGLVCRKTQAVVPNPVPEFNCFVKMRVTSAQYKALYLGLKTSEMRVDFSDAKTGAPLLGSTTKEKSASDYFCQKHTPVVPNPVSSYDCWRNLAYVK